MSTFAQDASGDFAISGGVLPLVTDPALAGAIKLRNRFRLFAGEWFLDTRVGVPYFTSVFGVKNPDLRLLRQLFTRVILQTPPFVAVPELDVTFDASARTAALTFIAQTDAGALVKFTGDGEPFIIAPGGAS